MGKNNGIPKHLAVIPDGHRRHARDNGGSLAHWYTVGANTGIGAIDWCLDAGVEHLSVFALSRQNIEGRSDDELRLIFAGVGYVCRQIDALDGVAVHTFGNFDDIPEWAPDRNELQGYAANGNHNGHGATRLQVNVAVNYAGDDDLDSLARGGGLLSEGIPEVDLVMRTGGDRRLSGFLPRQISYAELWFTDRMWPELTEHDFRDALDWFARQRRSFGA